MAEWGPRLVVWDLNPQLMLSQPNGLPLCHQAQRETVTQLSPLSGTVKTKAKLTIREEPHLLL